MRNWMLPLFILLGVYAADASADVYRWIEAERPILTNFPSNPFAPTTDAERATLSGGAWLGASGKRAAALFAVYDVDVPAAGMFRFYARKFWKHGPYRVSFNEGPWLNVSADVPLLDEQQLRPNIVANWTAAGTVTLKAGRNRFRIESTTDDGPIAFDCFLLTDGDFVARGLAKPDERLKSDEPGWFAWDPPTEMPNAPIDLRSLNEPNAGDGGTILARDGHFVHETTGEPIRFWGVNCGSDVIRFEERDLDQLAAVLASRGVNLVRLHGPFYATQGKHLGDVDVAQLANIQRAVRIFKRHGIYSTLSIYFPAWLELDASNGWPGYKKQTPFALLFFDEKLQAMYRGWWRSLLTTPDATGTALKDEPAVLSLELVNEDSLFFWTFAPRKTIPAPSAEELETQFGTWLAARYGSPSAAIAKWSTKLDSDVPDDGRVGVLDAGAIANTPNDLRSRDTARFLFELERDFFASTRRYLHDELGTRALVSGGNWTTANDRFLTPLERAANLSCDFIDRHGYYNAQHDGPRAAYAIDLGDTFADRSALRFDPEKQTPNAKPSVWNPLFDTSYNNAPTMLSEVDWPEPNRYRAELPLLAATLGARQDLDAISFFAAGTPSWQPTISKFSTMSPATLAQYPAASLIYRQNLIDESNITIENAFVLEDLLKLNGGGSSGIEGKVRWLDKLHVTIGDSLKNESYVSGGDVDGKPRTIRSHDGQLTLDYGRGVMVVDAPRAKVFAGFLNAGAGQTNLGGVSIQSSMEFGAIAVVSLDNKPIGDSTRLLVQVMSEQHNAGWKISGDGVKTIESLGHAPILVREFSGSIHFTNGSEWTAQPLGQNDQPLGEPLPPSAGLTLQPTTVHYVLTRVRG